MNKFYPTSIDLIRNKFLIKNNYPIISNISYTYQYIEYLDYKINKENNTTIIYKMLIKDYIVNSISIIEALFYLLLKDLRNLEGTTTFNYLLKTIIMNNTLEFKKEDITLLYKLKTLRNKIHIYNTINACNTDYNTFTYKDYLLMKKILFKILNSKNVSNNNFSN